MISCPASLIIYSINNNAVIERGSVLSSLLPLEETWKLANDQKTIFGALLIYLSKAFDCMSHDLLIAKLDAYGLDSTATRVIGNYLKNRKQRTKIGSMYSDWFDVDTGVPQGSILGPLLFNVNICDLFYYLENTQIANYADDTTPFAVGDTWEQVRDELVSATNIIFDWLPNNQMQGNADTCQLITNQQNKEISISVLGKSLKNCNTVKILGINFDNQLSFDPHIRNISKVANLKISALSRISPYLSNQK